PRGHADLVLLAGPLGVDPRPAEQVADLLGRDRPVDRLAGGELPRHLARHGADLSLELADAALAGVPGDDRHHGVVGELDTLARQARLLELARDQVRLGDLGLFALGVAGEL